LSNVDRYTEFKYANVVSDFSIISTNMSNRFELSVSDISCELISFLKTIYASND